MNRDDLKGPWFATRSRFQFIVAPDWDDDEDVWTVSADPNDTGWETDSGCPGYGVSKAKATLMAAAPELLEALQILVVNNSHVIPEAWEKAAAAIAKATGQ